ncbi:TPM domain-containing protein [Stenotrophomonas maltophilia group sp. msm1]|uniref:TPM domain-containing protein n=1 Tax=Stenotrophomonas maltophilia group sp. msm1 TaxID=3061099 RepID=UPI002895FC59|nr:TPM domain-containing protein [Stenotrophomonas maltophilia group sp. msm1]MDT3554943.1 TPM domain-containing protein [Stenotrophomonas maltophilia group sp. msm1]
MSRMLRWRNAWQRVGLALLLCLLPLPVLAAASIPALDDPVVDTANALSASTRATLREQALQLQARKGAQLQVLVVPSVGDDGIEAYAQRVFEQWQLGRAGVDDGVLLLVAVQDRRVRIQTGYGLEGTIPDAYAARIIDKAIVPRLREGDLDQGLLDGSKVLVALIDGEPLPPQEDSSARNLLPADWRTGDSVVALTLLVGFLAGLWRSPPRLLATRTEAEFSFKRRERRRKALAANAAMPRPNWPTLPAWGRPLLVTAVMAAGLVSATLLLPRHVLPALFFVLLPAVPVAALLGWCWRRSRGVRIVLCGMLAVSIGFFAVMLVRGQLPPSLALHTLLNLAVALAAMLVFFLVQAGRARWRRNRNSFAVRLVVLVLLTGAYALGALLAIDRASDENARVLAMIVSSVGTLFLYFIWLFTLLPGEKARSGRRSSQGYRSSSSTSSSSSSSSSSGGWSGGGGRSGGGGASGSW